MLFHTPHLADKYQGTRMILDLCAPNPAWTAAVFASTTWKSTRSASP